MHILINAGGSDRGWIGIVGAALVGDQQPYLVDCGLCLGVRVSGGAMIGLGAGRAAGAAAAVPQEWEVTVIIGAELGADAGWPGRAAVTVVGVLALVVRTASPAARLHDV